MPNVLSFETKVDLSGLNSGLAQGTANTAQFAGNIKSAMQAATEAANRLADAQRQLGTNAAQYSAQSAAVIQQYEQELRQAQSAVEALSQTETREAGVLRNSISARMAAGAELRVLSGNAQGSTRAVAALISQIPALASAAQAAFTAFGLIAATEIAVEFGKKLYEAFDLGGERARKTQQEIEGVNLDIQRSTDSLNVQIDRLAQEQAKLEHKPFNGIKLVLDEAAESADRLAEKLEQVVNKEKEAIAGMSASIPQQILGGTSTKDEQVMVEQHAKWIGLAKSNQDQLNESMSYAATLQSHLNDLQSKQNVSNQQTEGIITDYSNEIKATQQLISWQQQEQANIKATIALNAQQGATQTARDNSGNSKLNDKANAERLKAMEAALSQEKLEYNVSVKAEYDYWQERIDTFNQGSAQYDTILQKMSALAVEGSRKADEGIKRYQKSAASLADLSTSGVDKGISDMNEALLKQGSNVMQTSEAWNKYHEELAKSPGIQAQATAAMQLATIAQGEAVGTISKVSGAQATAAIHAADWAAKIAALNAELARLQALAAAAPKDPVTGQLTNGPLAGQIQGVQNQLAQTKGQSSASGVSDQTTTASAISKPYLTAFDDINNGFLNVQKQMILGTRSISRDFANMGAQLVVSLASGFEKALAEQITMEIKSRALNAATIQVKNQQDAAGAAEGLATAETADKATRLSDAKTAFANTYKVVSNWPVVGPVLAPVLAAGAFAAVAAYETGGIIPNTGMAMVHQGEAVLPKGLTNLLMNTASSNSNSSSVTQNNHYSGMSDAGFRRMMSRNADHTVSTVRRGLRKQGKV